MRARLKIRLAVALALVLSVAGAAAQRGGGFRVSGGTVVRVPYNGKVTFTRVRYNSGGGFGRGSSAWNHDYPQADTHLPLIVEAITAIEPNLNVSNILDLEDPEIFRNPILYMWEPGGWQITDEGAANLRAYLLKAASLCSTISSRTSGSTSRRSSGRRSPKLSSFRSIPHIPYSTRSSRLNS
jgi:hypothetical protein